MFKLCAPVGINVSYHASTGYTFKDRKPSLEFLEKLVKEFGVNLNWLFADEGEMFNPKTINFEQTKKDLLDEVRKMLKDEGIVK